MALKFLIDECLSPALVRIAHEFGHHGSTSVRDRGLSGAKDHQLIRFVVEHDFTLVTCNSVDFRGNSPAKPGGEYARQPLHAGLICLNAFLPLDLDLQRGLFRIAMEVLEAEQAPMINQALEIFLDRRDTVEWVLYDIPSPLG